ncbi:MAG: MFS transporter, partial [Propionibacteriaceae bacterium]|nr:MFS transporter [Propionibacteriaceae bacterium]
MTILRIPGAAKFCSAALLARLGGAMIGIGIVLMVSGIYGSYGLAGGLAAVNAIAWAIGTAILSWLVDRHGQRKIMLPAALVSAAALAGMVIAAYFTAPLIWLFVFSALSGFTNGSPGAMVRARWNNILHSASDLHTAYALESTLDEIGFIVGPVLATWLATSFHPTAGLVAPVILMAGGAMIFYSLTATQPPVLPLDVDASGRGRFILTYRGLAPVVSVGLLMGCMFGSIDVTVVAATTGWESRSLAGVILAVCSVGSALGGLLYGARGWSSPLWKRFAIGVTLTGVTACSFLLVTNPLMLGIFGLIWGFSIAPTFINANGLIGQIVPASRLTEGLAWLGTTIGI